MAERAFHRYFQLGGVTFFPARALPELPALAGKLLPETGPLGPEDALAVYGDFTTSVEKGPDYDAIALRGYALLRPVGPDRVSVERYAAADPGALAALLRAVTVATGGKALQVRRPPDESAAAVVTAEGFVGGAEAGAQVLTFEGWSSCGRRNQLSRSALLVWAGRPCRMRVALDQGSAVALSGLVKLPVEIAGALTLTGYAESEGPGGPAAVVAYDTRAVLWGSKSEAPAVYAPFSFHTHPSRTIGEAHLFAAWPSAADMAALAFSFTSDAEEGMVLHLVVAQEGVWFVNPSAGLQALARRADPWKLHGYVEGVYDVLASARSAGRYSPIRQSHVTEAFARQSGLRTVGEAAFALGLSPVVDRMDRPDDPLFRLGFAGWSEFRGRAYVPFDVEWWPETTPACGLAPRVKRVNAA